MTFEEFKTKLVLRGCQASAINGPTVAKAYDIIASCEETTIEDYQQSIKEAQEKLVRLEARSKRLISYENALSDKEDNIREREREVVDYINRFNESLKECETPEGRDAARKLQLFVNAVEVETKYDNTSFITGVWAILSGEKVAAIDQLKKMNPKLFVEKAKRL